MKAKQPDLTFTRRLQIALQPVSIRNPLLDFYYKIQNLETWKQKAEARKRELEQSRRRSSQQDLDEGKDRGEEQTEPAADDQKTEAETEKETETEENEEEKPAEVEKKLSQFLRLS